MRVPNRLRRARSFATAWQDAKRKIKLKIEDEAEEREALRKAVTA